MKEIHLKVPDMSCGHCVGAIQRAMETVDGVTAVDASLDTKIVKILSDRDLEIDEVLTAVRGAGYTPQLVP
jgi:copper chaperone